MKYILTNQDITQMIMNYMKQFQIEEISNIEIRIDKGEVTITVTPYVQ